MAKKRKLTEKLNNFFTQWETNEDNQYYTENNSTNAIKGHESRLISLYKEGNRLFSGSYDGSFKVWDLNVSLEDTL